MNSAHAAVNAIVDGRKMLIVGYRPGWLVAAEVEPDRSDEAPIPILAYHKDLHEALGAIIRQAAAVMAEQEEDEESNSPSM